MARKKQEMDNLAKDAARALEAGMSYGKWKAEHPHTKGDEIVIEPPKPTKPCKVCGKAMPLRGHARSYCSDECAFEGKMMRDAMFKQRKRERVKERKYG